MYGNKFSNYVFIDKAQNYDVIGTEKKLKTQEGIHQGKSHWYLMKLYDIAHKFNHAFCERRRNKDFVTFSVKKYMKIAYNFCFSKSDFEKSMLESLEYMVKKT